MRWATIPNREKKGGDYDRTIRTFLITLCVALCASAAHAQTFTGKADFVDGDSGHIGQTPVRLRGLHAPEFNHRGGPQAKAFMRQNFNGVTLTCHPDGSRTHGRIVATCFTPDGVDVAAGLVAAGLGRDCPRYSGGRYAQFETAQGRRLFLPNYCR